MSSPHRGLDLLFGCLAVEVIAPRGEESVLVPLDDRCTVHRDRCPISWTVTAWRGVGRVADPLEHGPVVAAADRRDLLMPVGHHRARLALDVAQILCRRVRGIRELRT